MLALGAALFVGAALPMAVLADGDPPKLEVDPPRVAAGSSVTVHGIDLPDPGAVSIELIGGDGAGVPLGIATADHDGTFWFVVTIPATTTPGAFVLRAVDGDREVIEVPLQVGPALIEQGEQRGADEPLLMPIGSPPMTPADQASPGSSLATPAPAPAADNVLPVAILLVVAVVVGGLVLIGRRRSRAPSTGTPDLP